MEYIAWPIAALVFAVAFLFIFRPAIMRLIDRTKSISKDGISATPEQQAQQTQSPQEPTTDVHALMEVGTFQSLLRHEQAVKKNFTEKGLKIEGDDAAKVLVRHLAFYQMLHHFEATYNFIFGSQIALLKVLQVKGFMNQDEVDKYFSAVQQKFSQFPTIAKWTPQIYMSFLVVHNLVFKEAETYRITDVGTDFLIWLVKFRKSELRAL